MPVVKDLSKVLAGIPKGSWVAISHDEERVLAYASDLEEAIQKAKEAGEENPIVIRVPETEVALLL